MDVQPVVSVAMIPEEECDEPCVASANPSPFAAPVRPVRRIFVVFVGLFRASGCAVVCFLCYQHVVCL
jgi:hypothetical protein